MSSMRCTSAARQTKETVKLLLALANFIARVLADLPIEQIQFLLTNKKGILTKKLREVFEIAMDPFAEIRAEWEEFYSKHFGLTADFSTVQILPKPAGGSWRLIFIAHGLKMNAVLAAMRVSFKTWAYQEDLDATVTKNVRTSAAAYAIWVRDGIEPDEKYLGQSTRQADPDGKIGMTVLERMVLELKYFLETGKHLDEKGVTLCSGSRNAGGDVLYVCFYPDDSRVEVDWCGVDYSDPTFGLREAVVL
jgi:hypothetical protein